MFLRLTVGLSLGAVLTALGALVASADTWYWTGAAGVGEGNAFAWNNAQNWDKDARGGNTHTIPTDNATVVFGANDTVADTVVINLADMAKVGELRIEGDDAPCYQFGTAVGVVSDNSQGFWMGPNSAITIADDVVHDQKFMRLAYDYYNSKQTGISFSFTNNSENAAFVFESLYNKKAAWTAYALNFYGAGDYVCLSNQLFDGSAPEMNFYGTGKILWRDHMQLGRNSSPQPVVVGADAGEPFQFEIESGARYYGTKGESPFTGNFTANVDTHIFGDGFIAGNTHDNSTTGAGNEKIRGAGFYVAAGKTLTIDVPMLPWNWDYVAKASWWDGYVPLIGCENSVIKLNSTNACSYACRLYGLPRVEVKLLGNKNSAPGATSIGPGEIVFSPYFASTTRMDIRPDATLAYTGDVPETTDRDFFITNAFYTSRLSAAEDPYYKTGLATGTVANAGRYLLKLTGNVRALNTNATFVLKAESAPIEFDGAFAAKPAVALAVNGPKEIRMAQIPANIAWLSLMNGANLIVTGGTASVSSTAPVRAIGSGNKLILAPNKSVTFPWSADIAANGTLDITVPTGARVVFSGATASTAVPSGLTINAAPGEFTGDGQLVEHVSSWKTKESGFWRVASNWDPELVPSGDRAAKISVGGANYMVTVDKIPDPIGKVILGQGDTGFTSMLRLQVALPGNTLYDVGKGGLLCVTNGCAFTNAAAESTVSLSRGGKMLVSGKGSVNPGSLTLTQKNYHHDGGAGELAFTGDGMLVMPVPYSQLFVSAGSDDSTTTFTLDRRQAVGGASTQHQMALGDINLGGADDSANYGKVIMNVYGLGDDAVDSNRIFNKSYSPFGVSSGYFRGNGELNLYSGYIQLGNNGLAVPGYAFNNTLAAPVAVTGVVNQTGGYMKSLAYSAPSAAFQLGVRVGCAEYYSHAKVDFDQICTKGAYNLKGGTLECGTGYTIVGAGEGEGAILQSGGTFIHNSSCTSSTYTNHLRLAAADETYARTFVYPMIIGYAGGTGLYEISGGTATVKSFPMYLGTDFTDEFPWGIGKDFAENRPVSAYFHFGRTNAVGTLRVAGGQFTCSTNLFLGSGGGTGIIEMVGASGALSVDHLVATSGVRSVLRFVCDTNNVVAGVSPIKVTGEAFLNNTVLEVELGDGYAGKARIPLVECSDITGGIGSVTVKGKLGKTAILKREKSGIVLRVRRGCWVYYW